VSRPQRDRPLLRQTFGGRPSTAGALRMGERGTARRRLRDIALALGLGMTLMAGVAACSSPSDGGAPTETGESDGSRAITGEITVFAAASLTGTFTELASGFEAPR
jgi:hypothetical protein